MKKRYFFTLFLTLSGFINGFTQDQLLYKKIDTTQLYLTVYPSNIKEPTKKLPAIVFFFGGGWNNGTVKQFEPQALYFSQSGLVCILVDYRVK
jgi:acetyl esterase/lipase